MYIREFDSILYVGLMGIVLMLIPKSVGMVPPFLFYMYIYSP